MYFQKQKHESSKKKKLILGGSKEPPFVLFTFVETIHGTLRLFPNISIALKLQYGCLAHSFHKNNVKYETQFIHIIFSSKILH